MIAQSNYHVPDAPSSTDSQTLVTMSGTTTLLCWVIGTPAKQTFPVGIDYETDKVWGHVKKAIKEEKKTEFADIDANTLDLWKVCHCTFSHVMLNSQFKRSSSMVPNVSL